MDRRLVGLRVGGIWLEQLGPPIPTQGEEEIDARVPDVRGSGDDGLFRQTQTTLGLEDREEVLHTSLVTLLGQPICRARLGDPLVGELPVEPRGLTENEGIFDLAEGSEHRSRVQCGRLLDAGPGRIHIGATLAAREDRADEIGNGVVDKAVGEGQIVDSVSRGTDGSGETEIGVEIGDCRADAIGRGGELHLRLSKIGSAVEQGSWQTQRNWLQRRQLRQGVGQGVATAWTTSNENIEYQACLLHLAADDCLRSANRGQILTGQVKLHRSGEAGPIPPLDGVGRRFPALGDLLVDGERPLCSRHEYPRADDQGDHRVDEGFLGRLLGQQARPTGLLGALESAQEIGLPGDVEIVGVGGRIDRPSPNLGEDEGELLRRARCADADLG